MTDSSVGLRDPLHQVSPRAKTLWAVVPLVAIVPAAVALIVVAAFVSGSRPWTLLALVPLLAVAVVVCFAAPRWRYRFHRWEVGQQSIYFQQGWFTQKRTVIPISRIQMVDTIAGPFEQLFGLAQLTVTTASSVGTVHIVGLDATLAKELVADLTARTIEHANDAT